MSNTESVRLSGASTAPIHSSSIAKLRSISGGASGLTLGVGENDSSNWLDAFSEIFARMAASDAAPQVTETTFEPELQQDDSAITQAGDDPSKQQDHAAQQTEAKESSLSDEQVSLALSETGAAVTEMKPVEVESGVEQAVDSESVDSQLESLVSIVEVDAETAVVGEVNPQAISDEVLPIQVESLVNDSNRDKNRGKQNREAVIPVETELADADTVATAKQVTTTDHVGPETDSGNLAAASTDSEETSHDSGRRSRRGRRDRDHDRSNESATQNISNSSPTKRSGGIPISSALSGSTESAPLPATQNVTPAADKQPPSTATSAAAVQATAKVAAAAANAGRATSASSPTGLTSNVQSTARATSPVAEAAGKKPTTPSKHSQASEAVNRAKLIQRVSKAFQHLGPDGGHVRLRLAPAELGTVRLEMRMNDRRIQARVVAESEAAGSALREHLPELRQRLESQGIQIERFEIEVESSERESRSSLGQNHSETHQRGQDGRDGHGRASHTSRGDDVSQTVSRIDSPAGDIGGPLVTVPIQGGVDVRL